jgi:hypothetical protein
MRCQRHESAIDAVACLIQEVYQGCGKKQLAGALFLDIKDAFDHVDPGRLIRRILEPGLDREPCLMGPFISGRPDGPASY